MVEIGVLDGGLNKSLVHDSGLFLKYYDQGGGRCRESYVTGGFANFGDGLHANLSAGVIDRTKGQSTDTNIAPDRRAVN
jgi:hypothetical protein